ncbi:hypothetical protein AURDEDRAFT_188236 [Auricularia subglabra TFB-10046 SS5]|uniref:Uncharacterized protein n=1 Tax=Auricularia subglabra (strain TFB-10046 / SS5) TaxID=717982 RepID=J0LGR2_AURST|nr:hypothetical protein AURDEDRAFT_188236 [Auricularia subglabra TFB-10046 SS5]
MVFEEHPLIYAEFTPTPGASARREDPPTQTLHQEQHLRSNLALQDTLSMRILDLEQRMAAAAQLIKDAGFEKRVLEARLLVLAMEASVHQRAFSPIRTLPQEMLGEIFEHLFYSGFTDDTDEPCGAVNYAPARAAFAVASVSRAWRTAALSRHALWSRIEFYYHRGVHGARKDAWLLYLRTHLDRARARPLSIYIDGYAPDLAAELHGQLVLRVILEALPRCSVFQLRAFAFGDSEHYTPLHFQVATPLLEEFLLLQQSDDEELQYREYARFLPDAPRLRKLTLEGNIPKCVTLQPFPVLEQLTLESSFSSKRPSDIIHALRACEHISRLDIGLESTIGPADEALVAEAMEAAKKSTLVLPNLKTIVSGDSLSVMEHVAPFLVCPNLQSLEPMHYDGSRAELRVMELIGSNVTSLTIGNFGKDDGGTLPPLLRALPRIEELSFDMMTFHTNDFAPLCGPDDATRQWIAPRLQRVSCGEVDVDGDEPVLQVLEFVKSRTVALDAGSAVRPLRAFTIHSSFVERQLASALPEWVAVAIQRLLSKVPVDVSNDAK